MCVWFLSISSTLINNTVKSVNIDTILTNSQINFTIVGIAIGINCFELKANSNCSTVLYKIKRVERIEKSERFIKEMESISMRKAAARKAVETKTAKTIEWANSIKFNVPTFNRDKLLKKAIYHYEQFHDTCVGSIDDEFAARISTNYIRHECTNYDMVLGVLDGKVGRAKAYEIIKEKVNQTIKNQHEWLKFDYHQ